MGDPRLQGSFDWYNSLNGYGVIQGEDGKSYFAHHSNHPTIEKPVPAMRVTFLARPRPHNKGGFEAYDILRDLSPRPGPALKTQTKMPGRAGNDQDANDKITSDLQLAAQEALRLKRERRDRQVEAPIEEFPAGTRVYHPTYGLGTVVLVSREILSVRLQDLPEKIVDLRRNEVTKADSQIVAGSIHLQPSAATPRVEAVYRMAQTGSTLADYLKARASEVYQTLADEGIEGNNLHRYEEPAEATSQPQPIQIDSRVAQAFLAASNITKFYSHQIQARQALVRGKHVIISTPTASGKTEAYNPTILEELLNHPEATALYLFPLVALGWDQTLRLEKLNRELPASDRLKIGIYNSSVSSEAKQETLRADNRILVTTPDSLHYIFLPKPYPNWSNFYRNLRYIVVDEAHLYKGVFGANMANIIRRLLVRCRRKGNPRFPQVIISSATIRHPLQLAQQLTGFPAEDFEVITESGAPKPGKHFLVTRSDIHELESLCSDLLDVTTTREGEKQPHPVSTIVFLRSINEVKQTARNLREQLSRTGRRDQAALVDEFYSDKADKPDVLERLRKGTVRCLFTTTALMAGIDIGSLDVAIVKNFPRLVMDARQMFGRAGRAGEGAVVFIADRTDPFDQFYFEKSELLFQGPTENVVANPENPYLLAAHLLCAAQLRGEYNREGPLSGEFVSLFGATGRDLLDELVQSGKLYILSGSYYLNTEDPHDLAPLDKIRSMSSETFILKEAYGQLLEEKRLETAFRDAHREAIVWVNGQVYQVVDFNLTSHLITCQPHAERNVRTKGLEEKTVEIKSIDLGKSAKEVSLNGGVTLQRGEIEIITRVQAYLLYKTTPFMQCRNLVCRYETPNLETRRCPKCNSAVRPKNKEEVEDKYPIPTPPTLERKLKTRAAWLNFPATLREQFSREFWPRWENEKATDEDSDSLPDFEYALHSVEHAILKAFPEYVVCDQDEIAGVYQLDLDGQAGRLFIYDNFPGGLGLSDEFLYEARAVLEGALDLIERCTCLDDDGCPVCMAYFGCHNFNQALSKLAGRYLLRVLLDKGTENVLADLKEYVEIRIPLSKRMDKAPRK